MGLCQFVYLKQFRNPFHPTPAAPLVQQTDRDRPTTDLQGKHHRSCLAEATRLRNYIHIMQIIIAFLLQEGRRRAEVGGDKSAGAVTSGQA